MAERQTLTTTQEQRLMQKLSPLQVQYARMLEMTGPEMEEEVRRQLDDNPALEAEDASHDSVEDSGTSGDRATFSDYCDYGDRQGRHDAIAAVAEIASADSGEPASLMEYLERQLDELDLTERQKAIAMLIAGNLDANGYMTRRTGEIADDAATQLGIDIEPEEVGEMWQTVRSLDPAGVGAVDLRDCLLLQLDRIKNPDKAEKTAREMIAHYFDLFAHKNFDRLMSEMGINRQELADAIAAVRSLNPKPGSQIGSNPIEDLSTHVIPDFTVETDGSKVSLSMPDTLPSLRIEESFDIADAAPARQTKREREAAAFIRSKRDEAMNFIQAVRMRRKTLYDVMRAIISLQPDFFMSGGDRSQLRPMILKDVAEKTGYDVSVVSRATAGKYVATRTGIHSLKSLFGERPGGADSDASAAQVISALTEAIENEDPAAPLSDDALVNVLSEKGFDIARRTVAKYRDRAGFPVARLRRRLPQD
ncbi:MAG: RNA polymerase factor sigma-54 [Paramuribaculum sp.]|nr:RNA polymerase factor sigma-54 [Paramuribaculum sp.]